MLRYGDFFLVVEKELDGETQYLTREGEITKDEEKSYILSSLREAVEKLKELCPKDLSPETIPCIYRVIETGEGGKWKWCEIYEEDGTRRKTVSGM